MDSLSSFSNLILTLLLLVDGFLMISNAHSIKFNLLNTTDHPSQPISSRICPPPSLSRQVADYHTATYQSVISDFCVSLWLEHPSQYHPRFTRKTSCVVTTIQLMCHLLPSYPSSTVSGRRPSTLALLPSVARQSLYSTHQFLLRPFLVSPFFLDC